MKVLEWSGEIGWELWTPELRAQLKASKGDDLTIRFSSVGGSIFEGGDIFNMLSDHKKDNPGIHMNLEIKSVAASYGSLIASSQVWDDITVEPTTMFMLHNPWSIAIGDFAAMQAEADFLKSARNMFIGIYAKASDSTDAEITEMMDNETWLFGDEIVQAGFADKIAEQPELSGAQNKVMTMASMKAKFTEMKKRQKEISKDEGFDENRAAACLRVEPQIQDDPGKPDQITPVESGNLNMEVPKVETKAELKKELPGVYDEVVEEGVMKEREENKTRMSKLAEMKASEDYKDIPEAVAVIEASMVDGSSTQSTETKISAAMVKLLKKPGKIDELESPGDLGGGDPQTPVMKDKPKTGEV